MYGDKLELVNCWIFLLHAEASLEGECERVLFGLRRWQLAKIGELQGNSPPCIELRGQPV